MASYFQPNIQNFKSDDAAISVGMAVKIGSDREHVTKGAAVGDDCIGIAQSAVSAAEQKIEVALLGGGAKGLAQTTVNKGNLLCSHTDGKLKPVSASGDRYVAVALEDAVAGDLFSVMVCVGQAVGAD